MKTPILYNIYLKLLMRLKILYKCLKKDNDDRILNKIIELNFVFLTE